MFDVSWNSCGRIASGEIAPAISENTSQVLDVAYKSRLVLNVFKWKTGRRTEHARL